MEACVRDCGSSEVGRLASLRFRNALLEKSRGPGRMRGVRAENKGRALHGEGENMRKDRTCGGGASEPESADVAGSATISTSAEGSAQVQTNFEIATNLHMNLGGLAGVEFANTRFAH